MIKLEPGQLVKFKASPTNVGPMTINGQQMTRGKTVTLRHPDGSPAFARDIKQGQAFTVDPDTGIITLID